MRSYRTKLQAALVLLGLTAIGIMGWETSGAASGALREATYERLTAIAQTKRSEIEQSFRNLGNHVLALSSDESTVEALELFQAAWNTVPSSTSTEALPKYCRTLPKGWCAEDPQVRTLHKLFIAANPHPEGMRQQLLKVEGAGRYGEVHSRFHPTFQRYQGAFGFYDTFLLDTSGRILYTVMKEVDLGARLSHPPYSQTSLSRLWQRAMAVEELETYVVEDFQRYLPSSSLPAAFYAAPIWRRGSKIGVLAIQISTDELNRITTSGSRWCEEGLGDTGQAYIVGPDNKLRTRLRHEPPGSQPTILNLSVPSEVAQSIRSVVRGTHVGRDFNNIPVLRSHTPLTIMGFNWALVTEIEAREALAPVLALQWKMLGWGAGIGILFFLAATFLAKSVTEPVLALAKAAGRLGRRDFDSRIEVRSNDEIGALAASFNAMTDDLQRTTVSKEELEVLAGQLITAQEDERARIARELHDDLTQRLAAVAIELGLVQRGASKNPPSEDLSRIRQEIISLSDEVHDLSRRLHTSQLDHLGLVAAIEAECRNFFERGGPPVSYDSEGEFETVAQETQLGVYRIVQEALRNIFRHANAAEVWIRLFRTSAGVELEIRDDGRGFDRDDRSWKRGVGLASMQERANLLGGACTIVSRPGEGTQIKVTLPVQTDNGKTQSIAGG